MKTKLLFLLILTFFVITESKSQNDSIITDVAVITADTMTDNAHLTDLNSQTTAFHSPKKATLLSTFIPGAGQIYNKQAWKVPIIYLAAAGVTYFAVTNGKNKEKFKDEYYNRINGRTDLLLPDYTTYTDDGIYNLYNAYKSNFQLSIIVGVVFYAVQILDAYVYGHLFNFDLTDDLTMNVTPFYTPIFSQIYPTSSIGINLNLRF